MLKPPACPPPDCPRLGIAWTGACAWPRRTGVGEGCTAQVRAGSATSRTRPGPGGSDRAGSAAGVRCSAERQHCLPICRQGASCRSGSPTSPTKPAPEAWLWDAAEFNPRTAPLPSQWCVLDLCSSLGPVVPVHLGGGHASTVEVRDEARPRDDQVRGARAGRLEDDRLTGLSSPVEDRLDEPRMRIAAELAAEDGDAALAASMVLRAAATVHVTAEASALRLMDIGSPSTDGWRRRSDVCPRLRPAGASLDSETPASTQATRVRPVSGTGHGRPRPPVEDTAPVTPGARACYRREGRWAAAR